ncbi:NAD-dependent epimerase/dehydratase family protein [Shewanella maritima]|uniref:NAD-dependent epimerase/dehydratase family protein n=1 Tax=Shewanella maritima TaxID=2520507 RepID=A0A411PKI5_9GAMM|nr:alcohol dehydrogenase family protein [Shewanella maritima]QBF84029.1 NAD-dependent epimerase/dehydratase family protein [Shewanella maritima]
METIPNNMSAVQLLGHGGVEKLVLNHQVPVPTISASDVLIKVAAAGVNNTDLNTRKAWYSKSYVESAELKNTEAENIAPESEPSATNSSDASWSGEAIQFPRIQGADVCGIVVAVGEQVDKNLLGRRVLIEPCVQEANDEVLASPWYFGSECDGGFAQYTKVAAKHAYPVSSELSDVELASFPCSYSTAENMLTRVNATERDLVLISGASGGVGSAAIQLAKARGAKVIAITSKSKFAEITAIGADVVLDRNDDLAKKLGQNSVDVVIDLVAGEQWPQFLQVLKPFGRYATSGAIAGPIVELDVRTLYLKDLSLFGCTILAKDVFANLIARIEAKQIKPLIANRFALSEIAQAQQEFELKKHIGKLVIDLSLKF